MKNDIAYTLVSEEEIDATVTRIAAEIARDAEVKQLVIGHFSARYEDESVLLKEAQSVFPATLLAKENLRITL